MMELNAKLQPSLGGECQAGRGYHWCLGRSDILADSYRQG